MILIPASSIKGAISHRTTYHYNLQNELFIETDNTKDVINEIFGEAKQSEDKLGFKGKVIFSDLFVKNSNNTKVFEHVSIDRFTGGGIDGALFQEKTIFDDKVYSIEILLRNSVEEPYKKAFEATLNDICSGMLPLGGATTKGHGIFTGVLEKL
jgi:CRISPR/Cas system CMR subunit Cmr4 (Cas7 group RAMP superfamily)